MKALAPFFPDLAPAWTAGAPLPGGDMPDADFDRCLAGFAAARPWLPAALARHLVRLYGTRADRVLDGAADIAGLGPYFGGLFHACEARYLMRHEWARSADDILDRRTKHGLHLTPGEREGFTKWLAAQG
jgi:glycerol-3-phosphate dehydrogenase